MPTSNYPPPAASDSFTDCGFGVPGCEAEPLCCPLAEPFAEAKSLAGAEGLGVEDAPLEGDGAEAEAEVGAAKRRVNIDIGDTRARRKGSRRKGGERYTCGVGEEASKGEWQLRIGKRKGRGMEGGKEGRREGGKEGRENEKGKSTKSTVVTPRTKRGGDAWVTKGKEGRKG
ncbi:hypothetical protein B0H13DRAFT_1895993 [Mycena leptocephala]|nr:hypothetical protein B0H13DRAFT_1895993 [Mycena leptocephala]